MADAISSAWVEVLPDFSGFQSSVNSTIAPMLGAAGAAGGVAGASKFGGSLVAGIGKLAAPILAAVTALGIGGMIGDAVRSGIDLIGASIDQASALQQSSGAIDAIFADSAATIHQWAVTAAQDVGLSQNAYNELASRLGAQLKNLGVPLDEVAGKTNELIGLGADLAAQFGGTTSDAVAALSSLLRGERDPIERYGVTINDARLKAKLAEMGLDDLTGAALDQAKAQATLALLYEQTAAAQGTFARESDTLAGAQQRQQATFDNLQAKLGTAFLPLMTTLANVLAEDVAPELEKLIDDVGPELTDALTKAAPAIAMILIQLARFLPILAPIVEDTLPALTTGIAAVSLAVGVAAGPIRTIIGLFIGFQRTAGGLVETLAGLVGGFTDAGRNLITGFIEGVQKEANRIADAVLAPIRDTLGRVRKLLGIASPSKVFAELGAYTAEGFIKGVDSLRVGAQSSLAAMVQVPRVRPELDTGSGAPREGDRPIIMDGSIVGVLREVANGEARIVLNEGIVSSRTARLGK